MELFLAQGYQNEKNGEFVHNAGRYADANPVFRWRHTAVQWNNGSWSASLTQSYLSHYTEQNADISGEDRKVSAYTLYNMSGSYSGFKNLVLTAVSRTYSIRRRRSLIRQQSFRLATIRATPMQSGARSLRVPTTSSYEHWNLEASCLSCEGLAGAACCNFT